MSLSVLFVCTANICRSPYLDLADPHRRGEAAAAVCAATVLGMLGRVLPLLTPAGVRLPAVPATPDLPET